MVQNSNDDFHIRYRTAIKKGLIPDPVPTEYWHTFVGAWIRKHPRRTALIDQLRSILGDLPKWEDLSDDTFVDLKNTFSATLAPNTIRTYCQELIAFINYFRKFKTIPSTQYKEILHAKKVISKSIYLTKEELEAFHNYKPTSRTERYAWNMFLRECVTGARHVDCKGLSMENISKGKLANGEKRDMLVYYSQKNMVEVSMPVHSWLKGLLQEDVNKLYPEDVDTSFFNRVVKRICKKVGIIDRVEIFRGGKVQKNEKWHFVGSHTGRRTFATLLYLKGAPLEDLAMMMGHLTHGRPNIKAIQDYICAQRKIRPEIYDLFG